jgi:anti-anti-sigma factor
LTFDDGFPDSLGWDGHLALLHTADGAYRAGLAAWVRAGLDHDEKVIYTETGRTAPRGSVLSLLHEYGVGVGSGSEPDRLLLLPLERLYAPASREEIVDRALAEGFRAVRVAVEATSALTVVPWHAHAAFEQALQVLCRTRPVSALCQYDQSTATRWPLDAVTDIHAEGIRDRQLATLGEPGGLLITGEVDADNEDVLAGTLQAATSRASETFRLDLSRLAFLGGGGCRAIVSGTARFRDAGGYVLLVLPQPIVERVLRLLGCDQLRGLEIVPVTCP